MPPSYSKQTKNPKSAHGHSLHSLPANRQCRALHDNGSDCRVTLLKVSHVFCPAHHHEYRKLHHSYKLKETYYKSIALREADTDTKDTIEAKLAAGKETLALRDQVNRRFFNFSAQNRGHIKWIMKLQSEIRGLEQKLAVPQAEESAGSSSPARGNPDAETKVLRPLLDPAIPMSALSHLPSDSPVVVLKQAVNATVAELVEKLYAIAPSLDDSSSVVLDDISHVGREPDARDFVIRFLFRELLLYKADAHVLARATRTQSINTFLRESSVEHLELYLKFFEAFLEGRHDMFRLLRDAICDYLLDPQSSSTTVLGAEIATEESSRKMNTKGWDVLFVDFHNIVEWWSLDLFAIRFEDLVLVKTLILCLRYGSGEPDDVKIPNWYVPDEDVSQECEAAVMQGFIAVTKGYCDPVGPSVETEHGITKESQTRCCVVGRMSKKNTLAPQLAQELNERVARFLVLVYDREEASGTLGLVSPSPADQNPWIRRSRSAPTKESLGSQPWTVQWSVENVLDDLDLIRCITGRNMASDYYEFIIIDRTPGRTFDILDAVADALSMLTGDRPYNQVFRQAIQTYVPADEQDGYLKAVAQMEFEQVTPSASRPHLGNRVRCWDAADSLHDVLLAVLQNLLRFITLPESRLISKVAAEMESHGIITRITDYEPPRTMPIIMRGIDGHEDLYFHYDLGPVDERVFRGSILDFNPSSNSLVEFSEAYQLAHPNAVFTKGKINVHYCAWPIPMLTEPRYSHLNFRTPEGRMYRWKVLPFDMPMASRVWQLFVDHEINNKFPFIRLMQTTLVLCAEDPGKAKASLKTLLDIGEKHGWTFSIPSPSVWTTDFKKLDLGSLYEGVRPAL